MSKINPLLRSTGLLTTMPIFGSSLLNWRRRRIMQLCMEYKKDMYVHVDIYFICCLIGHLFRKLLDWARLRSTRKLPQFYSLICTLEMRTPLALVWRGKLKSTLLSNWSILICWCYCISVFMDVKRSKWRGWWLPEVVLKATMTTSLCYGRY